MNPKPPILYIDDDQQNLVSFKANFRRDYQVFLAKSGEEALALLAKQAVELVITDQRMPEMTGVELLARVRQMHPETIRMVMTAYSDVEAIIDAINEGQAYYFISKPWKKEELKLIIDNGLEAYRLKTENRDLTLEKQRLELLTAQQEKEQILSRFETLKNQLNPHFLFNSLNVLSSLVHDDPEVAEGFIAKLTRVYRYVLDLKNEDLVPLERELSFAESFIFLHQIRFGNNLRWYVEVSREVHYRQVPPLTLQLLIENAIKHNIISQAQPLTVELFVEQDTIIVRNTYQPRPHEVESTGIGLQNLRERYRYLTSLEPTFRVEGNYYTARVPLLDSVR